MNVFVSWSGPRSRTVAIQLREWLSCVLQIPKYWVSTEDIEPGQIWFEQITESLCSTDCGIICLTRDNKRSPWIHYEAGALNKGTRESRLWTLLIDLEPTEVEPPLGQFQVTEFSKEGMYQLVKSINGMLEQNQQRSESQLQMAFEANWPSLDQKKEELKLQADENDQQVPRPDRELLEEILSLLRDQERRERESQTQKSLHHPNFEKSNFVDKLKREVALERVLESSADMRDLRKKCEAAGFSAEETKGLESKYWDEVLGDIAGGVGSDVSEKS